MADEQFQEKTEQATPKRREEARNKGQVAKSQEVATVLVLLSAIGVLFFTGSSMFGKLKDLARMIFRECGVVSLSDGFVYGLFLRILEAVSLVIVPLLIAVFIAGIVANVLQVGFLFTGEPLVPKLSKLNPIKGLGRLFSMRSLGELVKSLLKLVIIASISYLMIRGELKTVSSLVGMEPVAIFSYVAGIALDIFFYTALAMIILAIMDYAFQKWQHEKNLRMTKQEVKEENKQKEGDPLVRSRIKKVQKEMAQQRMMQELPEADVVVTNPTSLAVALKYESEGMSAPQVIAKGAGFIAERIKKIAGQHDIPTVEHKPLARALYKTVEIGDVIPAELYRAVAEVLAYVYRLKGLYPDGGKARP